MEALNKTPNQSLEDSEPAEQAGVFLESLNIFPFEMNLLNDAITRVAELRKVHGDIQQVVRSHYDNKIHWHGPMAIDLYAID